MFAWLTRGGHAARKPAWVQRFFAWKFYRAPFRMAKPGPMPTVSRPRSLAAAPCRETIRQSFIEDLRVLPTIVRLTGVSRLMRGAAMAAAMEDAHPREPCFYLAFIGVAPEAQGAGLGTDVLAHTLARVDQAGAGAYLENSNPRNTPLYQRAGFSVTRKIVARDGAPPIYAMWRPARHLNHHGSSTMSQ